MARLVTRNRPGFLARLIGGIWCLLCVAGQSCSAQQRDVHLAFLACWLSFPHPPTTTDRGSRVENQNPTLKEVCGDQSQGAVFLREFTLIRRESLHEEFLSDFLNSHKTEDPEEEKKKNCCFFHSAIYPGNPTYVAKI